MSISVQCTQCSGSFQVADKYAGSKIRCPKCKVGVIQVAASQSRWDDGEFRLKPDETIYDAAAETSKRQGSLLKSRSARRWVMRGRVWLGSAIAACGLIAAGYFLFFGFGELDVAGPDIAQNASLAPRPRVAEVESSGFDSLGTGDSFVANSRGNGSIEPSIAPAAVPAPNEPPNESAPTGAVQANMRPGSPPFVPSKPAPASATSSVGEAIASSWPGAVRMRSKLHPFEINFPTGQVISFPGEYRDSGRLYLHRPEAGLIHTQHLLHGDLIRQSPELLGVRVVAIKPGESQEEVMRRADGILPLEGFPEELIQRRQTNHEGYPAEDMIIASNLGIPGGLRFRKIFHPSGVYSVTIVSRQGAAAQERFIESFHFLDAPGVPGDGSRLIPVATADGPRPTTRNISGAPDSNGEFVLWEEIPVE